MIAYLERKLWVIGAALVIAIGLVLAKLTEDYDHRKDSF